MFSLIITIISIALVTALALATIYYGGSAFRGTDRSPSEPSKRSKRQSYESPWFHPRAA